MAAEIPACSSGLHIDGAGGHRDMTESIQVLIAQNLGVDESRVTEGARLREDLGMDEISSVELAMALDELTGTETTEEDMEELTTVQDIIQYLQRAG